MRERPGGLRLRTNNPTTSTTPAADPLGEPPLFEDDSRALLVAGPRLWSRLTTDYLRLPLLAVSAAESRAGVEPFTLPSSRSQSSRLAGGLLIDSKESMPLSELDGLSGTFSAR